MRDTLLWLAAAVLLAACGSNTVDPVPPEMGFGGATTSAGRTSGGTTSSKGQGGGFGNSTIDGLLAFSPTDSFSENTGQVRMFISINDSADFGCIVGGASHELRIDFPSTQAPGLGRYDVDGGTQVTLFDDSQTPIQEVARAQSGDVYLDEVDEGAVRGNFDVILANSDGGNASELHGVFNAGPCS